MTRRNKADFTFPAPESDPADIRVVPEMAMRFPEAHTTKENERRFAYCWNRRSHNWVRSITNSLKQKITEDGTKYWLVKESTVWCWDCGVQSQVRFLEDLHISRESYERLVNRNPEDEYQGVET